MARKGGTPHERYREGEPDVTSTGLGKNYDGHRMFHMRKTGLIEHIMGDGSTRLATMEERERFRRDLTRAAGRNADIGRYLGDFPGLRLDDDIREAGEGKDGGSSRSGEAGPADGIRRDEERASREPEGR